MAQNLDFGVPEEFVSKTATYDYNSPITKALSKIHSLGAVIVEKDKEYYGIVDHRSITKRNLPLSKSTHIGKFADQVPVLDNSTSIDTAILHFYNTSKKALPYTAGKNKITGIVKREMMLRSILSRHLVADYQVGDHMTSPVIAIDENANVAQAAKAMQDNKIGKLIVLSEEKIKGVITRNDIIGTKLAPNERAPQYTQKAPISRTTPTGSICQTNFYSIEQSKLMENAIRSLIENHISSLIVTNKGKPVGIISTKDILEVVVAKSQIKDNRVVISGLDEYTKEYEGEIIQEMQALIDKISKFHKIKIEYLSLTIKRPKAKNYEIRARLITNKKGSIAIGASGFSLDEALKRTSDTLYKEAKDRKDMIITGTREREAEDYEQ